MKVYIYNEWFCSGGPENIHQLCSRINDLGIDCYLIYAFCHMGDYVPKYSDKDVFVPEYKHYNLKRAFAMEDSPENVVIIPESFHPDVLYQVNHMKVAIWWLSIDNPKYQWKKTNPLFKSVIHCYHADKAAKVLSPHIEREKIVPLHDYINDLFIKSENELIDSLSRRKNRILYNPKKQSEEVTKELKNLVEHIDPSIEFRPIEGMTLEQISNLGMESKVYIDFGFHPGREHLPREMAISGCSVITGDDGVASDDDDVPLYSRKFKKPYDFQKIAEAIVWNVRNHSSAFFDEELVNYRKIVRNDKSRFESDVDNLLRILQS
jgi:hypothetical protein